MTPVVLCKCGLRFEVKGLAAGTTRKCPMCHRELVVPNLVRKPTALSQLGRKGLMAGSVGLALLVGLTGGLAIAYSGVLTPAAPVVASVSAAKTVAAVEEKAQPSSTSSNLAATDSQMLSIGPVGGGGSSESPLIPPR